MCGAMLRGAHGKPVCCLGLGSAPGGMGARRLPALVPICHAVRRRTIGRLAPISGEVGIARASVLTAPPAVRCASQTAPCPDMQAANGFCARARDGARTRIELWTGGRRSREAGVGTGNRNAQPPAAAASPGLPHGAAGVWAGGLPVPRFHIRGFQNRSHPENREQRTQEGARASPSSSSASPLCQRVQQYHRHSVGRVVAAGPSPEAVRPLVHPSPRTPHSTLGGTPLAQASPGPSEQGGDRPEPPVGC